MMANKQTIMTATELFFSFPKFASPLDLPALHLRLKHGGAQRSFNSSVGLAGLYLKCPLKLDTI